jgi:hypothetical protein
MKLTIIELENQFRNTLDDIAPGICYYDASSTIQGDETVMGRHLSISIPMQSLPNNIKTIIINTVQRYYGEILKVYPNHSSSKGINFDIEFK